MNDNKWEKFAKTFEEKTPYVVGLNTIETIKKNLSSLSNLGDLLELGCGNGTYTECFFNSAKNITATDVSETMLEITKNKFQNKQNLKFEQADCSALPYDDSSFDTVFMANLLHVILNKEETLAECFRVLKKNGRLIITSYTSYGMNFFGKLGLIYRYLKTYDKSGTSVTLTPNLTKKLVSEAGFKDCECKIIGGKTNAVFAVTKK